ncbi:MAG: glutamine amidotransferase [Marinicellaceae bacterium]
MSKFIAIIQTGEPIASVLNQYGGFDQMFIQHMQIAPEKTKTYHVYQDQAPSFPSLENLAGIIITGSPSMVTEKKDWSEATIDWLKKIVEMDIPTLGVCYGHQLLACALGGQVDWNPNGRQIGNVKMQLSKSATNDPLFSKIHKSNQSSLNFNATHSQSVIVLPKKVQLLGSTNLDPNHCFRYKNHIWGAQFHPEFSTKVINAYIIARSKEIEQEGLDPKDIQSKILHHKNGAALLKQFKNICFNH